MNAKALAHIERILAEAHEAAADLMHIDYDAAKAHLAQAALAVAEASKALDRRISA